LGGELCLEPVGGGGDCFGKELYQVGEPATERSMAQLVVRKRECTRIKREEIPVGESLKCRSRGKGRLDDAAWKRTAKEV